MNLTYFINCVDFNDVKKRYKELCKINHPDVNPNVDVKIMQDINVQYSYIEKNSVNFPIQTYTGTKRNNNYNTYNPASEFKRRWDDWNRFTEEKREKDKQKYYAEKETREKYNKQSVELENKIHEAWEKLQETDYKKIVLYHKFVEYCIRENKIAEKKHFELIAQLLGYKEGWAFYKYQEYIEQVNGKV